LPLDGVMIGTAV